MSYWDWCWTSPNVCWVTFSFAETADFNLQNIVFPPNGDKIGFSTRHAMKRPLLLFNGFHRIRTFPFFFKWYSVLEDIYVLHRRFSCTFIVNVFSMYCCSCIITCWSRNGLSIKRNSLIGQLCSTYFFPILQCFVVIFVVGIIQYFLKNTLWKAYGIVSN